MSETDNNAHILNWPHFYTNRYPGRGIVMGLGEGGRDFFQVYWIMGRSDNSKNRVFGYAEEEGRLFTEPADPAKVKDPSLIIYNAMREYRKGYQSAFVVSNGHQTDGLIKAFTSGVFRAGAYTEMLDWIYEPDAPNNTPRIAGICYAGQEGKVAGELIVWRKSPWGKGCDRDIFYLGELPEGVGFCVTTYRGDGDPLPSFAGRPFPLEIQGDAHAIARKFWRESAGYFPNLVSLAVKRIDLKTQTSEIVIKNKLEKVA